MEASAPKLQNPRAHCFSIKRNCYLLAWVSNITAICRHQGYLGGGSVPGYTWQGGYHGQHPHTPPSLPASGSQLGGRDPAILPFLGNRDPYSLHFLPWCKSKTLFPATRIPCTSPQLDTHLRRGAWRVHFASSPAVPFVPHTAPHSSSSLIISHLSLRSFKRQACAFWSPDTSSMLCIILAHPRCFLPKR